MLVGVSTPLHICVLDNFIDLLQFRLGKHHITTCGILKGTLGVPGEYDQRCKRTNVATYDDPGRGMTCDPREPTHPIDSCAGVIFFFLAISIRVSAMTMLCLKFCCCDKNQKCVQVSMRRLTSSWKRGRRRRISSTDYRTSIVMILEPHQSDVPGMSFNVLICPVKKPLPSGLYTMHCQWCGTNLVEGTYE